MSAGGIALSASGPVRAHARERAAGVSVDRVRSIADLAAEWDALADRLAASPFERPGWFAAWTGAFGDGEIELLVARRGGRLAGVFPLARRAPLATSATNDETPRFEPLAEDAEALQALCAALFAGARRGVSLSSLAADGDAVAAVRAAARAARWRIVEHCELRSPFIPIAGAFEDFERTLNTKFASGVRRRRRRLEDRGTVTLEVTDARGGREALLEEGFRIESAGWKGGRGTAIASDSSTWRFYRELAAWAARRGELRLAFLRLDGRALAFDLCLEDARSHYLVKTGFDPAYSGDSPGMVLRREMIVRAFAAGLETYELLGHREEWKRRWSHDSRAQVDLRGFARSGRGLLDWLWIAQARPLAKRALRRG